MVNFEDLILHQHGDTYEHMTERRHADAADLDSDRRLSKGARTFDCSCGHVFVVGRSHAGDLEDTAPIESPA